MAKYLHLFDTTSEFDEAYNGEAYLEPWVSYTEENTHVNYNKTEEEKLPEKYFTFEIVSGGSITWKLRSGSAKTIQYRKNGGAWSDLVATTAGTSFNADAGDVVEFKGNNPGAFGGSASYAHTFSGTSCVFKVSGNIMSLCFGDNFKYVTAFTQNVSSNAFGLFFMYCTGLTDAEKLVLPLRKVTNNCYNSMFLGCVNLVKPPKLPATELDSYCYSAMFQNCSNLAEAPALPATTLAIQCYGQMFDGCASLTTAPALPATALTNACYSGMFKGCASLTEAPALPATTLTLACYDNMFKGCASLTEAPALPATTLAKECYSCMFQDCTSLTTVPSILPVMELQEKCYSQMFYGCTSLTTAPELPATTLAKECYRNMFWLCTSLNYIKCLATDRTADNCTANWVDSVASTGTFVKNSAMTSWPSGINGIPRNWTIQDA